MFLSFIPHSQSHSNPLIHTGSITHSKIIRHSFPVFQRSGSCRNITDTDFIYSFYLSGKPDPPYDLQFVNATHNSLTIRWKPGFNGGLDQSFRVRFKPTEARGYVYVDVSPPSTTLFTVTGKDEYSSESIS